MLLIRRFEEKVEERFRAGELPGFLHVAIGQEAVAVGVCRALEDGDVIASTHRAHGHTLAKGTHPNEVMAELYGKLEGCSHGYGGSMHLYDVERGNLGANAVVGGGLPAITGAALAFKLRGEPRVAVAFFGDGATNIGTFHESLNLAQLWKVPARLRLREQPLGRVDAGLAAAADRGPRRSARSRSGCTRSTVDGQDVEAVYDAAHAARSSTRATGKGPVFLARRAPYRLVGHYVGDPQVYRAEGGAAGAARDAGSDRRSCARELGVSDDEFEAIDARGRARSSRRSVEFAQGGHRPEARGRPQERLCLMLDDLPGGRPRRARRRRCARDDDVFIMGEDIAEMGGSMGVTQGMLDEFGPERVRNTPISEMAIVGAGIGAAMQGMRPVVEIMYEDFLTLAMEQIVNQAAKHRYMSGGQLKVPLTIRTQGGAGWSPGAQHAQQLEAWFVHVPGLKVVFASTPTTCAACSGRSIYDDNPVLFFEHRLALPAQGARCPTSSSRSRSARRACTARART